MKKICISLLLLLGVLGANAQGWPENYGGVMLQGFYWDSFKETKWTTLEKQAEELGRYFSLVWVPQSGNCGNGKSMGYNPLYYWKQNSSFGTEENLRSMIKTFKANGIGTVADVVVNHRGTLATWTDFPEETYKGITYTMLPTDICKNDDGGATKEWADKNGIQLSQNYDEGEDWKGMRDLDHRSANVQNIVKAYTRYLVDDLGYAGFRYDMVKGFNGSHVADYNKNAGVEFSVGEHWSSVQETKAWINSASADGVKQSAAFDFQLHYRLADAVTKSDWSVLSSSADYLVNKETAYRRYAVTFVENHDTQYRSKDSQGSCPISSGIAACNAYMMAIPGTPCVFLKHWIDYKKDIKMMIEARKLVGITNTSTFAHRASTKNYAVVQTIGTGGKMLLAVVGSRPQDYNASQYKKLCEGEGYIYYVNSATDTSGWADIMKRIEAENVAAPEEPYDDHDITIYVSTSLPAGWSTGSVNYWVWSESDGSNLCTKKTWPGDNIKATKTIDGKTWFCNTYRLTKKNHPVNIVLSSGTGSPQTVDFNDIETDKYFEIKADKTDKEHEINDVTNEHATGITDITGGELRRDGKIYSISGQVMGTSTATLKPGLYIINGKKKAVRQ